MRAPKHTSDDDCLVGTENQHRRQCEGHGDVLLKNISSFISDTHTGSDMHEQLQSTSFVKYRRNVSWKIRTYIAYYKMP